MGIERASLGKPIVPIVKETRLLDMEEGTELVWRNALNGMQEGSD